MGREICFFCRRGPNWLNTHNTIETISSYEVDTVHVNNVNNKGAWKAGVGYYALDALLFQRTYINHLLFEINVYQITGTIVGDVEQYQLPQFTNYSYYAPFTSTRLMFDFKPYLTTYKCFSPYFILGIGSAWNSISYTENIIGTGVSANSNLVLGRHTITQLAGDLGIGLSISIAKKLHITAEYVYGFMGDASPTFSSSNNAFLQIGPNFMIQTQSALFGLNLTL